MSLLYVMNVHPYSSMLRAIPAELYQIKNINDPSTLKVSASQCGNVFHVWILCPSGLFGSECKLRAFAVLFVHARVYARRCKCTNRCAAQQALCRERDPVFILIN